MIMFLLIVIGGIFIIWNAIVFIVFGIDKKRAKRDYRRIKESTLLICSFLMGGLGALVGMIVFHHKTQKNKFRVLVPLSLIVNLLEIVVLLYIVLRSAIYLTTCW